MTDYLVYQELFTLENLKHILFKTQELYEEMLSNKEKVEDLIALYKNHFREDITQAQANISHYINSEDSQTQKSYTQEIKDASEDLKIELWKDL